MQYNTLNPNVVGFADIVQDARAHSDLGTLFGNLFGQVVTGVTDAGVARGTEYLRDQGLYSTAPDGSIGPIQTGGSIPKPADPATQADDGNGAGTALAIGIPALLIGGVVLYLVMR